MLIEQNIINPIVEKKAPNKFVNLREVLKNIIEDINKDSITDNFSAIIKFLKKKLIAKK